jgi:hypothetical protein
MFESRIALSRQKVTGDNYAEPCLCAVPMIGVPLDPDEIPDVTAVSSLAGPTVDLQSAQDVNTLSDPQRPSTTLSLFQQLIDHISQPENGPQLVPEKTAMTNSPPKPVTFNTESARKWLQFNISM